MAREPSNLRGAAGRAGRGLRASLSAGRPAGPPQPAEGMATQSLEVWRRAGRQAGARRRPARCTLWVPRPQTVRMRAQGPQVRMMGARPLGRAIWQRLPRQAWALQCVPRLEKSFHLSLRPTHQSHKGTSRQGSTWWSPKVAGLAETGASKGRGARGAGWGCFTTRVRRAGASAGAHRDGVWCAVLPGRPPPDRQAGGQ